MILMWNNDDFNYFHNADNVDDNEFDVDFIHNDDYDINDDDVIVDVNEDYLRVIIVIKKRSMMLIIVMSILYTIM